MAAVGLGVEEAVERELLDRGGTVHPSELVRRCRREHRGAKARPRLHAEVAQRVLDEGGERGIPEFARVEAPRTLGVGDDPVAHARLEQSGGDLRIAARIEVDPAQQDGIDRPRRPRVEEILDVEVGQRPQRLAQNRALEQQARRLRTHRRERQQQAGARAPERFGDRLEAEGSR